MRLEYLIVGLGVFGIITLASDVRVWLSSVYLDQVVYRTEFFYSQIPASAKLTEPFLCREPIRTDNSPSNFDEITSHFEIACDWVVSFESKFAFLADSGYPEVDFASYGPPVLQEKYLNDSIDSIRKSVDTYNEVRREMLAVKSKTTKSSLEEILFLFGPLALCFALALQMTKVSADLGELKK